MTKILAVCNTKGGSGKTTLAANLAHMFFRNNKKVLLIDLSGAVESGLTKTFLGTSPSNIKNEQTIAGWLQSLATPSIVQPASLSKYIKPVRYNTLPRLLNSNISIIAGTDNLSACSTYVSNTHHIGALRKALQHIKQQKSYDIVIIDCPSGELGVFAKMAVVAADAILVPTKLHKEDVREALAMLTKRLSTFVSAFNQQYPNDTTNPLVVFAPIQVNTWGKNLVSTQQAAFDELKSRIGNVSCLNVRILPHQCSLPESDTVFSSFVPMGLRTDSIRTNQGTKNTINNALNNIYHGIMNALGHQSKLCSDHALQYRKAA